ncbi:alpha-amylase family glycosyl hydrolase [Aridibaculum aurantiacum]|uniref:alpha-amylase family glycosyl hydrolase n=1 Tax=Aridibaculum aurantiacum TaxID=2810307 RepID=UPI001A978631|nr:alpha-amylase family glycosyl hydrolase [Aridibaculum aurantiacum]
MSGKFSTPGWAASSNIYEVNIRQYTPEGTLQAFARHLPRLQQMGVEILWFMPLTPVSLEKRQGSLGSYYACSDYTSLNPDYGTNEDFLQLVNQAHELGMKVLVDIVANHTGYDHVWTKEHPEFYKKNEEGEFFDSHGWVDVIDLDYDNEEVHTAMVDVMKFWVQEFDVDGFRCDMAHLVPLEFWQSARTELDTIKPLFWLAETEDASYHEVFDASFTWNFLHLVEDMYRGNKFIPDLLQMIDDYAANFPADAYRLYFITNHDENSHSGSEYERLGNAVRAIWILCATSLNSIPLMYSGQEIPNKRRLLFFEKDPIDWSGQCMLADFYKTLYDLRKRNSALAAGDQNNQMVLVETTLEGKNILAYLRTNHKDSVLVLLNLSHSSMIKFKLTNLVETGRYRSVWSGLELEIDEDTQFELQAWEYLVYEKQD